VSANSIRAASLVVFLALGAAQASGEDAVLNLRAKVVPAASGGALTVTVFRWSTDAERTPLLTALSAPPPPPPAAAAAAAAGRAGAAGRGGRGNTPPPTPLERLATAVRTAPTLGYIWGEGVTGYSIKYAWRSPATVGRRVGRGFSPVELHRVVLVTDRRLGVHAPDWALPTSPGPLPDFTVIELRLDAAGAGEGKISLSSGVVVDAAASTLALDRFAAAPTLLEVSK
jgi:hypothetical protein